MAASHAQACPAPWVTIIIVNYNSGSLLQVCVDALLAQTMTDFEVVIVDNCSSDGSADALQLPDARFCLLRSEENIGFAAANNRAAKDCRSIWIATLNPDTIAAPSWLDEMCAATQRYLDVKVFGATLIDAEDPSTIDGFGDVLSIAGLPWRGGHGHPVSELPDDDAEVFAPCAAAALYDRQVFHEVGGFDESFFCYVEDVDLGFRLRLRGERCMQLRRATVLHYGSATTGALSPFTIFHSFRNRFWMLKKNMPLGLFLIAAPTNILCSLLIIVANGRRFPARAALTGLWQGIVRSPGGTAERHPRRRISIATVSALLAWRPSSLRCRSMQFLG